jgi:hypothetical protein
MQESRLAFTLPHAHTPVNRPRFCREQRQAPRLPVNEHDRSASQHAVVALYLRPEFVRHV